MSWMVQETKLSVLEPPENRHRYLSAGTLQGLGVLGYRPEWQTRAARMIYHRDVIVHHRVMKMRILVCKACNLVGASLRQSQKGCTV